jgi:membrane-bound lytic murein transglycosylase B
VSSPARQPARYQPGPASRGLGPRAPRLARVLLLGVLVWATAACAAPASTVRPQGFETWLEALRREALSQEISAATLDAALTDAGLIPRVVELDRRQPEFTLTFEEYLSRTVSLPRVLIGRQQLVDNQKLLEGIGREYGVQPRFIVALWGVETDYGRLTGGFPVVNALVTLAYDGRRSEFFRGELLNALRILDQQHIPVQDMTGSWAGAMGQVQFMPSSFLQFAVDYDGDGRRDIWNSRADALASAANYLARSGWNGDQTWGRTVQLPSDFDTALIGKQTVKPLSDWQALGVRRADGGDLPGRDLPASLVQPGGPEGPTYAVYPNYQALLKWNRSDYFATAVGTLADRIGAL